MASMAHEAQPKRRYATPGAALRGYVRAHLEAIEPFDRAFALTPEDADTGIRLARPHFGMGKRYEEQQDIQAAAKSYFASLETLKRLAGTNASPAPGHSGVGPLSDPVTEESVTQSLQYFARTWQHCAPT